MSIEHIDPRNWEYVTTQGGSDYYRTGYDHAGWPIFAKRLRKGWRAFEACHHPIRWRGTTIDATSEAELVQRIVVFLQFGDSGTSSESLRPSST